MFGKKEFTIIQEVLGITARAEKTAKEYEEKLFKNDGLNYFEMRDLAVEGRVKLSNYVNKINLLVNDIRDTAFGNDIKIDINNIYDNFLNITEGFIYSPDSIVQLLNICKMDFIVGKPILCINQDINVLIYLDIIYESDDQELPIFQYGFKFLNNHDDLLYEIVVYKGGDGCINSSIANERRKNIIQLTIALAEYYLSIIRRDEDIKINKKLKLALPITDLQHIEDYEIVIPNNAI